MFYLFLAIICSSTIAFIFKYSQKYNTNQYLVTSSNYLTAFTISLVMIINKGMLSDLRREESFSSELNLVITGAYKILGPYNSLIWGIIVGVVSGVFFFLSFTYYQKSVKQNGVGLSGTFAKLGILIPMIFSIIIWREFPTEVQWTGIILSLVSIVMVNLSFSSIKKLDFNLTLTLLFIFGGMAEFSSKIYQKYALNEYKDIFLFTNFLIAFFISIFYAIRQKVDWNKRDILIGVTVGIPNLFSSYFLILSLDSLSASVAFPVFSAGSILSINIGGYLIFKEKISNKNKLAIGLIILALILMNI